MKTIVINRAAACANVFSLAAQLSCLETIKLSTLRSLSNLRNDSSVAVHEL